MKDEFNEYSAKNNLNITIELDLLNFDNPSDSYSYFKFLAESSLKKSNNGISNKKFDVYYYSNRYTKLYAPYLLDLNDNLPKEHIEMYNSKVIKETCSYKDKSNGIEKLVGLVRNINKI